MDSSDESPAKENQVSSTEAVASHPPSSNANRNALTTRLGSTHVASTSDPVDEHKPTLDEAIAYVTAVKGILQEEKEKYQEFLKTLNSFKSGRISEFEVRETMKRLLKEHPVLYWGMINFMPNGYKFIAPATRVPSDSNDAKAFLKKVKERFDEQEFLSFLRILTKYRESYDYLCIKASMFLKGHYDLLKEFGVFLPSVAACQDGDRNTSTTRSAGTDLAGTSNPVDEHKPADDDLAGTSNPVDEHKPTDDEAKAYIAAVKGIFQGEKEKYDEFLEIFNGFGSNRIKPIEFRERMKRLLKDHPVLFWGMNNFIPKGHKFIVPPDSMPKNLNDIRAFLNKVKDRFGLQRLKSFQHTVDTNRTSHDYICIKASVFFEGHNDLLDEFGVACLPPVEP